MDDTLVMSEPAWVKITLSIDGAKLDKPFDAYSLLDLVREGEEDHGLADSQRLFPLRDAVVKKFDIETDKIALNQVMDLREKVVTMTNRLDDERKKKFSSTADSPVSTQEFPLVSPAGPIESSDPGLLTASGSIAGG